MTPIVAENIEKIFFPGYKITNFQFIEKTCFLSIVPSYEPVCAKCASNQVIVHQRRTVKLTDCKIFGYNTILEVEVRVLRCKSCGKTHVERIAIQSKHGVMITARLEEEVIQEMEDTGSIKATSKRLNIGWDTCKKVHKRYLQRPYHLT